MATLWCTTCQAYHEPRSSLACAADARRKTSTPAGPPTRGAVILSSLFLTFALGWGVGLLTRVGPLALAAWIVSAAIVIPIRLRRLEKATPKR